MEDVSAMLVYTDTVSPFIMAITTNDLPPFQYQNSLTTLVGQSGYDCSIQARSDNDKVITWTSRNFHYLAFP